MEIKLKALSLVPSGASDDCGDCVREFGKQGPTLTVSHFEACDLGDSWGIEVTNNKNFSWNGGRTLNISQYKLIA